MAKMGRPKIPRETRVCACGECGETFECKINSKRRYINGHNRRGKSPWNKDLTKETDPRVVRYSFKGKYVAEVEAILLGEKEAPFCACGCGGRIKVKPYHSSYGIPKYIRGHHNRVKKYREEQSERQKGRSKPLGFGKTVRKAQKGKPKPKVSKALKGKPRSKESVEKQRKTLEELWRDPEYREKQLSLRNPKAPNPKNSRNMKRLWQDPEYKESQLKAIFEGMRLKPNKPEQGFQRLLNKWFVGEYQINVTADVMVLGNRVPDFVNINGQKKIIELFGDYWHGEELTGRSKEEEEEQRIDYFAQFGWKTLVVWEYELGNLNELKEKIVNFNSIDR